MSSVKTGSAVLLGIIFTLMASIAVASVKDTEEFTFKIKDGGRISLENINGDILISGHEGDTVSIVANKQAGKQEYMDNLKIIVDADSDYIRIETRHPSSSNSSWMQWGNSQSGSVSYVLKVPAAVNLDKISTVNGDVEISSMSGKVKAETVNGDLVASGLTSDVDLETVNGGVNAEFDSLGGNQRVSAEAVNGKIVLKLPADSSARVHAETVNGKINAKDFDLEVDKGFVGRECDGDIGSGEARISLDTVNGSISIVKR
jgi:DUF4097 and DUF4098 domain-containing protein YvlB